MICYLEKMEFCSFAPFLSFSLPLPSCHSSQLDITLPLIFIDANKYNPLLEILSWNPGEWGKWILYFSQWVHCNKSTVGRSKRTVSLASLCFLLSLGPTSLGIMTNPKGSFFLLASELLQQFF